MSKINVDVEIKSRFWILPSLFVMKKNLCINDEKNFSKTLVV